MPLTLIRYPNPILNEKSIDCISDDLAQIKANFTEMLQIMEQYKGIGLAAVQVGILKRYCVMKDSSGKNYVLINPVLKGSEDLTKQQEGCLSLPYFQEAIERFSEVTVSFLDDTWTERTATFTGLEAQCLQHEIDHFDGILQFDKVSKMKQDMYKKRAKKKKVL